MKRQQIPESKRVEQELLEHHSPGVLIPHPSIRASPWLMPAEHNTSGALSSDEDPESLGITTYEHVFRY